MKATEEELRFHQRLLAGDDPTAFAELAEGIYQELVRHISARAGPFADPALVEEAVGQALLDYNAFPDRYDPQRGSLRAYLVVVAHRRFLKAQQKERRRSWRNVSLTTDDGTDDILEAPDELEALIARIRVAEVWPLVEQAFPDPQDRQVLLLIMNGVREMAAFAKALGITHLSEDEQTQHVNRAKNRIKKRLRRIGEQIDA